MDQLTQIYSEIDALYESFKEDHAKFTTKGNKAAASRARSSLGNLKKLVTQYRKLSVDAGKKPE